MIEPVSLVAPRTEPSRSRLETFPVAIYYPQGERKFLSGTYLNYFL